MTTTHKSQGQGRGKHGQEGHNIETELKLLDRRLLREALAVQERAKSDSSDRFGGVVVTDEEVVNRLSGAYEGPPRSQLSESMIEDISAFEAVLQGESAQGNSPLSMLGQLFGLARFEQQTVVLCLAMEMTSEYERIFAYLQDDLGAKRPTVDLALRLFCKDADDRRRGREAFMASRPLRRYRLLEVGESRQGAQPLPSRPLCLDQRIAGFLLGIDEPDEHIAQAVRVVPAGSQAFSDDKIPRQLRDRVEGFLQRYARGAVTERCVLNLHGDYGTGKRPLVVQICARAQLPLVRVDCALLARQVVPMAIERANREAYLRSAAVSFENTDALEDTDAVLQNIIGPSVLAMPLTFLVGQQPIRATPWISPQDLYIQQHCTRPDENDRVELWKAHLGSVSHDLSPQDINELAAKFRFTGGQISDAAHLARSLVHWNGTTDTTISLDTLSQAARQHASPQLEGLAQRIQPIYNWQDIVLPRAQLKQLRELVDQVRYATRVLSDWNFAEKNRSASGIAALFSGSSGTGKTMAADVIAADLNLELYKIDLSKVVSKYIGETEKNLSRIFAEAENTGAILFFDEADALFGKRSEVKDAHDRYANIEVAYLLQRIEAYSGIAILATNLKHSLDEAFVRRLRFIVDFPFPDEHARAQIWQKIFPSQAPLSSDIDLMYLARKLKLSGGNITNIALYAAFLAAGNNSQIDMACVIEAAKRELEKIGKLYCDSDFSTYPPKPIRSPTTTGQRHLAVSSAQ